MRADLHERLAFFALQPRVILDLGAGEGQGSRALKSKFPHARVIAIDADATVLAAARSQSRLFRRFARVVADANRLPVADASCDLIVSNLMLHCCVPPDAALLEAHRVLRDGGLFLCSTLGPSSAGPYDAGLIDIHDFGSALTRAGFDEPVLDVSRYDELPGKIEAVFAIAWRGTDRAGDGATTAEHTFPVTALRRRKSMD